MVNEIKMKELIKKRERLHPDDPRTEDYWNMLTKELTVNEDDTIEFICNCNEHDIFWLSEIFEDISDVFQSEKFIEVLKKVQEKYPKLDLKIDIMYAEKSLKNI